MEIGAVLFIFLAIAVLARLGAGGMDGDRVAEYMRGRGYELIDKSWDPFGPGWFGEKNARIYQVVYRDELGRVHRAHVKTSMMSGVYLTNDEIVEDAPAAQKFEDAEVDPGLEEENARLKERIRELEKGRGS